MALLLPAALDGAIRAHAEEGYPEEVCGFLVGRTKGPDRVVEETLPAENRREGSRATRYLIDPLDLLRADDHALAKDLELLGFYHSHPEHPARPSAFDTEHALPVYAYLIVSVRGGRAAEGGCFVLATERGKFLEEGLRIVRG